MTVVRSGLINEQRERRHIGEPTITPIPTSLYTDLYHVDSAYVAWKTGQTGQATFDLYTRKNPFGGGFMLTAGLGPAIDYLRAFKYTWEDREYLERIKGYEPAFLDYLRDLQFDGEILAIPEGEIAFPNEPLLRITASFPVALLIESGLLRAVGISTLIATKAARLAIAAQGRGLSDFSFRRAHEPFLSARSGYIGGCDATSFVAAAKEYDIPASGTIPHALVTAFATEREAFTAVANSFASYTLLLDTYDVEHATDIAIEVALEGDGLGGAAAERQAGIGDKVRYIGTIAMVSQKFLEMTGPASEGSIAVSDYVAGIDRPLNKSFEAAYKARWGADKVTHFVSEPSYFQIYLFKQAVEKLAPSDITPEGIRDAVRGQEMVAPQGKVKVEPENLHTWLWPKIGQCQADGQFKILKQSDNWLEPSPYKAYPNQHCTAEGLKQT